MASLFVLDFEFLIFRPVSDVTVASCLDVVPRRPAPGKPAVNERLTNAADRGLILWIGE